MDTVHKCLYSPRMTLGENIKFLREAKGLTYEAVGSAVGTDGQAIFNLEKRKSKVSKFAPALAAFFGVDLVDLTSADLRSADLFITGEDGITRAIEVKTTGPRPSLVANSVQNDDQSKAITDQIIELLALFQLASPRERENILDLARSIAKRNALRWVRASND